MPGKGGHDMQPIRSRGGPSIRPSTTAFRQGGLARIWIGPLSDAWTRSAVVGAPVLTPGAWMKVGNLDERSGKGTYGGEDQVFF